VEFASQLPVTVPGIGSFTLRFLIKPIHYFQLGCSVAYIQNALVVEGLKLVVANVNVVASVQCDLGFLLK